MQFNIGVIAAVLLASASSAMSATITAFDGANCGGNDITGAINVPAGECLSFGSSSFKSFGFSGIPNQIQFYVSGGPHDSCSNGDSLAIAACSGCATAPDGFNWESAFVF